MILMWKITISWTKHLTDRSTMLKAAQVSPVVPYQLYNGRDVGFWQACRHLEVVQCEIIFIIYNYLTLDLLLEWS